MFTCVYRLRHVVGLGTFASNLRMGGGRLLLHPSSHLIHQDCLRDAAAMARQAAQVPRLPTTEHLVSLVGDFRRPLREEDVQLKAGDLLAIEVPHRALAEP